MNGPAAPSPVPAQYREAFEAARPSLRGAPARRAAAFARFAELGFPAAREEAWKYTSLRRLEGRRFAAAGREASLARPLVLPGALGTCRLALANGFLRPELSDLERLPPGLRLRSAGGAEDAAEATALRIPAGGGTERFAALNAALSPDPLLIEVDAGVRCADVLHVVVVAAGDAPTMSHPRLVLRLGRGAAARVVVHYLSEEPAEHFVNALVDAELADGAELQLYRLQELGARCFHIERCEAVLGAGARLELRDSQLGGTLARLDVHVSLAGRAAAAELTGLFIADGSRHLDMQLRVDHRAIETTSLQDYRGVAAGRGRAVFNGKAIVHAGAQKSNARQSSRNLLLSPGAEIDTKPELEIYADDVQCSHGATTGQLDPAALFYLRSRGLSEAAARGALIRAFAGAVLSRVDHPALAARVHEELEARLGRLLEPQP